MTRTGHARIGLCLVIAVLLGAFAPPAGFAEEAPAKSDHASAHDKKGGNDEHGAREEGRDPAGLRDHDRVDTHDNVESKGRTGRNEVRELKARLKPPIPDHSRPRRILAHPAGGVQRNAIGVHLPPRDESRAVPIVVHGPPVAPGVGIGATGGTGKSPNGSARDRLVRPPPALGMVTAPANRGTIAGTAMTKPGTSSSRIGGPAKSVAGINGSTIKPRY
jgi:hypothetical protein